MIRNETFEKIIFSNKKYNDLNISVKLIYYVFNKVNEDVESVLKIENLTFKLCHF